MAKKFSKLTSTVLALTVGAISLVCPASADGRFSSLLDFSDKLTLDEETEVREYLTETANDIDCNIGVLIVEELNGEFVEDYAQEQMESVFGEDSDAAMLVLCTGSEGADCILTDGKGGELFPSDVDKGLALVDITAARSAGG